MSSYTRLGFAALLAAVGCSHNVQIPPSRPMALEAPATVGAGERRARVQLGHHGMLFEGDFDSGNLRLRTGLSDRVEIDVDGSVIDPRGSSCPGHNIYLGRVGLKLDPFGSDHFAMTAGIGGGYSPAGGTMISTDAGVIAGIHNRYVVPYVGASTFASAPVHARPVRTGSEPGDVDTPTRTVGAQVTFGLAFIRQRYTVSLGADSTVMRDIDGEQHVMSAGIAFEVPLE